MFNGILQYVSDVDFSHLKELIPKDDDRYYIMGNCAYEVKSLRIEGVKEAVRRIAMIVIEPLGLLLQVFVHVYIGNFKLALGSVALIALTPLKTVPCALICLAAVLPGLIAPITVWGGIVDLAEKIRYEAP